MKSDILRLLFSVLGVVILTFAPYILRLPSLVIRSQIGLVISVIFIFISIFVYLPFPRLGFGNVPFKFPTHIFLVLFGGLLGSIFATDVFSLDRLATRISLIIFTSLIEIVGLYFLSHYLSYSVIYILKYKFLNLK